MHLASLVNYRLLWRIKKVFCFFLMFVLRQLKMLDNTTECHEKALVYTVENEKNWNLCIRHSKYREIPV